MPAKDNRGVSGPDSYFHLLNRSVSGDVLFRDENDYKVFIDYLKDYLSPPAHIDEYRKEFIINGRVYRGVPHRNKNYFEHINLIAYSLKPNHFHLVLHQKTKGSIEKFMRSLSTRYSMYYNKKYSRQGKLFEGPYKSVKLEETSSIASLVNYLHKDAKKYSSYEEYLLKDNSLWVKPDLILSFIGKYHNGIFDRAKDYQNFIKRYKPTPEEERELGKVLLETRVEKLPRTVTTPEVLRPPKEVEPANTTKPGQIVTSIMTFFVLFGIGLNNIMTGVVTSKSIFQYIELKNVDQYLDLKSITQYFNPKTTPQDTRQEVKMSPTVAGEETERRITRLVVEAGDSAEGVNIREEPSAGSEKIGVAKAGDIFEFVSINSDWYKIQIDNETTGYIFSKYAKVLNENE